MVFAHDTELSLQAAVALANSAEGVDTRTTLDDLERYVREHEFTGSRTHDQAELGAAEIAGLALAVAVADSIGYRASSSLPMKASVPASRM